VRSLTQTGAEPAIEDLAIALEATAHGHAMLLLDCRFGAGEQAAAQAGERAARAVLALIAGRAILSEPTG
jgi:hypothetical protein